MLYLCCLQLLQTPVFTKYNRKDITSIALLAAALWAAAPIHTQAVNYIVQRMAQLAALFSVSAIFFYLLARRASSNRQRAVLILSCIFSALLALGSKENSILLLLSIPLIESIFYSRKKIAQQLHEMHRAWPASFLLLTLATLSFLLYHYNHYEHRNFTQLERLLTEPRILLLYLSQIFLPAASRLAIEHTIVLSTGLFTPWTTLPAIITCSGLIIFSLSKIRAYPLFSFAVLFFFLNHLVESTFLPLELIFEHRNYLPSLFLFLPIGAMVAVPTCNTHPKQITRLFLLCACTLFLIFSCLATIERNRAWSTELTLYEDNITKTPNSGRVKINLAYGYIQEKEYTKASILCEQAERLKGASKNKIAPLALNCKGAIAYRKGHPKEAVEFTKQALRLRPDYNRATGELIALLMELGRNEEALARTVKQYARTGEADLLLTQASLLLRLNRPSEGLKIYHKAHLLLPSSPLVAAGQGRALSMLGYYRQADRVLSIAKASGLMDVLFLCIENSLLENDYARASQQLNQLIATVPLSVLLHTLGEPRVGMLQIPFDRQLIKNQLLAFLQHGRVTH